MLTMLRVRNCWRMCLERDDLVATLWEVELILLVSAAIQTDVLQSTKLIVYANELGHSQTRYGHWRCLEKMVTKFKWSTHAEKWYLSWLWHGTPWYESATGEEGWLC